MKKSITDLVVYTYVWRFPQAATKPSSVLFIEHIPNYGELILFHDIQVLALYSIQRPRLAGHDYLPRSEDPPHIFDRRRIMLGLQ